MSDPLAQLPPQVRTRLADLLARLPADLKLYRVRRTPSGWSITLHDGADHFGAEIALLDEPSADDPPPTPTGRSHPPAA